MGQAAYIRWLAGWLTLTTHLGAPCRTPSTRSNLTRPDGSSYSCEMVSIETTWVAYGLGYLCSTPGRGKDEGR